MSDGATAATVDENTGLVVSRVKFRVEHGEWIDQSWADYRWARNWAVEKFHAAYIDGKELDAYPSGYSLRDELADEVRGDPDHRLRGVCAILRNNAVLDAYNGWKNYWLNSGKYASKEAAKRKKRPEWKPRHWNGYPIPLGFPRFVGRSDPIRFTLAENSSGASSRFGHHGVNGKPAKRGTPPPASQWAARSSTGRPHRLLHQAARGDAQITGVAITTDRNGLHASTVIHTMPERSTARQNILVGIDFGTYQKAPIDIATSDGSDRWTVVYPDELARLEDELAAAQKNKGHACGGLRLLRDGTSRPGRPCRLHGKDGCTRRKPSTAWKKAKTDSDRLRKKTNNIHEKWRHAITRWIVDEFEIIAVENIKTRFMKEEKSGAKGAPTRRSNAHRVAIATLMAQIAYKSEWAGRAVELIPPRNTSKTCSQCLHVQDIESARRWICDECGADHDRQVNACINIARQHTLADERRPAQGLQPETETRVVEYIDGAVRVRPK